jgi:hypothetical protein
LKESHVRQPGGCPNHALGFLAARALIHQNSTARRQRVEQVSLECSSNPLGRVFSDPEADRDAGLDRLRGGRCHERPRVVDTECAAHPSRCEIR